jgi:hypothetical protein
MMGVIQFRIKMKGALPHPIPIHLMFMKNRRNVAHRPFLALGDSISVRRHDFFCRVLNTIDVNICRCCFLLPSRVICSPGNPSVYKYIRTGRFFVFSRYTLGRKNAQIKKYQRRGFLYLGTYDDYFRQLYIAKGDHTVDGVASPNDCYLDFDVIIS